MTTTVDAMAATACPNCGTQLGPQMPACPGCGRLVHGTRLEELAATARRAESDGNAPAALEAWRDALLLLPAASRQHEIIAARITALGQRQSAPHTANPTSDPKSRSAITAGLVAVGLMAWKLKALVVGLGKGSTAFSMLASFGVYWTVWGWKFALGLVLSIYVHEMGHVLALRRLGFKATAPMFVPGLGAFIRMKQQVVNPLEDAQIGLAGPLYGLGAAVVVAGVYFATGQPIFAAIAGVGAWINLFNLLPIGSLDGGRGFHAMSRAQKFVATAAVAGAWAYAHDGLLLIVALVCAGRALGDREHAAGSTRTVVTYIGLTAALTALAMMRHFAAIE